VTKVAKSVISRDSKKLRRKIAKTRQTCVKKAKITAKSRNQITASKTIKKFIKLNI